MIKRQLVAALSVSGAALIGLAVHEGYRGDAYIPVPGDVPTIGFGSTFNPDGSPVRQGDRTDPIRALIRLGEHVSDKERVLRRCIGDVELYQHEWDAYVSWAYNVGTGAACSSTLVKRLKEGRYTDACNELLRWDKFKGKPLPGLTKRRQQEHAQCLGEAA